MAVIVVPWYVARPVAAEAVVREPSILVLNMNWVPVQACTKTPVFVFCVGCTKDRVEAAWRDRFTASVVNRPMQRTSPVLDPALPESACNIPDNISTPRVGPLPPTALSGGV